MENKSRKTLEKEARIKAILDTAAKLFSEKDFHTVTVDEIAEKVGLAKGTLYLYFKNKDDLFYSIIQEKTTELSKRLQYAIQEDKSYMERFENLIRSYILFFKEHEPFYKIIHSEKPRVELDNRYRIKKHVFQSFNEWIIFLKNFIAEGQEKKVIKSGSALAYAKALRGILNSFVFHWVFGNNQHELIREIPVIMDIFFHGTKHPDYHMNIKKSTFE